MSNINSQSNARSAICIQAIKPRRDECGWWSHPDYIPGLEEGALRVEFDVWLEANGVECVARLMEDEFEPGSPEVIAWESLDCDCSAWNPQPPEGGGWFLVSVHDTEDGPCAVWLRKLPNAQPTTLYDALLRFYRKLHDEHRTLDGEAQKLRHRCDYLDRKLEKLKARRDALAVEYIYQFRIRNGYNGQVTDWQAIKANEVNTVLKMNSDNAEFQIIAAPQPASPVPDELQDWATEIATDIRRASMLDQQPATPAADLAAQVIRSVGMESLEKYASGWFKQEHIATGDVQTMANYFVKLSRASPSPAEGK